MTVTKRRSVFVELNVELFLYRAAHCACSEAGCVNTAPPQWNQFVVYRYKKQDGAAADSDGLKELLKEQRFVHLLFNATLAICSVLERLPAEAAPGRWAAL